MKRKVVKIDTFGLLKHKYSNIEIHLKNENDICLPMYQIFLWWLLGFKYIGGIEYFNLMVERFDNKNKKK